MNLGRRVDYAVRALSYLASQVPGKVVSRAELETKQDIPSHYLSKILKDLVSAGLVGSQQGCKGGFTLARAPWAINMREIYEAIEGPLVLMECLEKGDRYCPYCSVCTQISVWDRAQSLLVGTCQ